MTTTWTTMTTKKRTKRKFENDPGGLNANPASGLETFRHPFPLIGHRIPVRRIALLVAAACSLVVLSAAAAPAGAQSSSKSHAHDFLIFATVFTTQGFALPGARVRVRREDEKKFRWEAMSDHEGELGIRVNQGLEYEVLFEARGFTPQTRKVDAREGNREDLTLQMEPLQGGKP